jgi:hypothetical protein
MACGLCFFGATASAEVVVQNDPWPDPETDRCETLPPAPRAACLRDAEARERKRHDAWRKVQRGYLLPLARHLAGSRDPRMLAVAATLWPRAVHDGDGARIRQLRELSFKDGGDDPVVAILQQADTPTEIDAGRENPFAVPAMQRWREIEPDNLVPAMVSGESTDTLLARADTFGQFSLHLADLLSVVDAAFATYPPDRKQQRWLSRADLTPPDLAAGHALDLGVRVMPSMLPLVNACKGDARHATPARNLQCRMLGRVMSAHSDSLIGELFGAALLRHDDDPAVRAEGDAALHAGQWQSAASSELVLRVKDNCPWTKMRTTPGLGEGDAIRACLRDAGIALEPPADWSPGAAPASGQ